MSSSAQGGSGGGADGKGQGFQKFIRRASKVMRRSSSNKGTITSPTEAATSSSPTTVPASSSPTPLSSAAVPTLKATLAKTETPASPSVPAALQQSIKDTKPSFKENSQRLAKTAAGSHAIQEEKARVLFVKYGFKLDPADWISPTSGNIERVEKIVRVRVRRTCHRCGIPFGADKVCKSCDHTRCKKCPRYPTKRSKDSAGKGVVKTPVVVVDEAYKGAHPPVIGPLTVAHLSSGKELSRRFCHKCETPFEGRSTECGNCQHHRCPQCPRDAPKLSNHPEEDAGESEGTSRREDQTNRDHGQWRDTAKEKEDGLDEEAVQNIATKLKNVNISPQAAAA